jgi:hypothetical protein
MREKLLFAVARLYRGRGLVKGWEGQKEVGVVLMGCYSCGLEDRKEAVCRIISQR